MDHIFYAIGKINGLKPIQHNR